ncbi:M-phase inducer phosphatase 3 isoform B [Alligator mississippiensis]|uniref:M-phase inducer phosphatase n=1 Tax=Alligator mississippiensis TaxID=8496 RepID=A0A151MHY0_ALLMI|nr:M-phase inducer phosphatase 3 isoform B [Alligator mississippiensis]
MYDTARPGQARPAPPLGACATPTCGVDKLHVRPLAGRTDAPGRGQGPESQRQCLRSLPLSPVSVPSCPFQPQVRCSTPGAMYCESSEMASPLMSMAKEGGWFKHPGWHVSKSLLFHKEVMDPLTCLTAPLDVRSLESEMTELGSPIAEVESYAHRTADHSASFAAFFPDEQEDMEIPVAGNQSSSMAVLLSGPLLTQDINVSEVSVNRSRLYRSPSMPEKLDRPALKRIVKGQDNETPVKVKRRCSLIQEEPEGGATLKKTASLSDMEITKILDQDHGLRQLIGDFSKVYALPTVTGRHQDLRYIIPETVAALLFGQFQSLIEMFYIIDCRYPYEYLGGHIKGALNLHRQEDLFELFLKRPLFPSMPQKRIVLVFHCEFSSERGPKMCRYLREEDRAMNEYPALHYPEMYVLKGGYKEFFPEYKELCEPQSYCPMHHQDFKTELLKFRTKSKSWAGERKRRDQITRLMKL